MATIKKRHKTAYKIAIEITRFILIFICVFFLSIFISYHLVHGQDLDQGKAIESKVLEFRGKLVKQKAIEALVGAGFSLSQSESIADICVINGGLSTIHSIPKVTSDGVIMDGDLLRDDTNHRVYFDGPFQTAIVSDTNQPLVLSANNQLNTWMRIISPNAGSIGWETYSTKESGGAGGGAFSRTSPGATIGLGFQSEIEGQMSAVWDFDMLGTSSNLGEGYDLSLNNKNKAASLRLNAGQKIILGIGTGEITEPIATIEQDGIHLMPGKQIFND